MEWVATPTPSTQTQRTLPRPQILPDLGEFVQPVMKHNP